MHRFSVRCDGKNRPQEGTSHESSPSWGGPVTSRIFVGARGYPRMSVRFPMRHSTRQVESTARSPGAVRPEAFDREALAQFASVRRAAWRLTRNVPEAEDLVQETYVRALRAFRHF